MGRELSLDCIEWGLSADGFLANPITSSAGRGEIRARVQETGVQVRSLFAKYFHAYPLTGARGQVRAEERARSVRVLEDLIRWTSDVGGLRVVVPFVGEGALANGECEEQAVESLRSALTVAGHYGVHIAVLTDLPLAQGAAFVRSCQSPSIVACVDATSGVFGRPDHEADFARLAPYVEAVSLPEPAANVDDHLWLTRRVLRTGRDVDFILHPGPCENFLSAAHRSVIRFRSVFAKARAKEAA